MCRVWVRQQESSHGSNVANQMSFSCFLLLTRASQQPQRIFKEKQSFLLQTTFSMSTQRSAGDMKTLLPKKQPTLFSHSLREMKNDSSKKTELASELQISQFLILCILLLIVGNFHIRRKKTNLSNLPLSFVFVGWNFSIFHFLIWKCWKCWTPPRERRYPLTWNDDAPNLYYD